VSAKIQVKNVKLTLKTLAEKLGIKPEILAAVWRKRNKYRPVKVGADSRHHERIVMDACPELKEIQRIINRKILAKMPISAAAHGFVPKKSFKSFLLPHRNSQEFLTLDFKSAFNQIKADRVVSILNEFLADKNLAKAVALLVTYLGEVPQGVASSPYIFNLACRELDKELLEFAKANQLIYTRYGDDLCFSSKITGKLRELDEQIIEICQKHGFRINFQKVKFQSAEKQIPEVSGILIEKGKFRISKRKGIDQLRALIYNATFDHSISIEQVEGRLGLLRMMYRASGHIKGYLPARLWKVYNRFRRARGLKIK